jgi:hypothetical protein
MKRTIPRNQTSSQKTIKQKTIYPNKTKTIYPNKSKKNKSKTQKHNTNSQRKKTIKGSFIQNI